MVQKVIAYNTYRTSHEFINIPCQGTPITRTWISKFDTHAQLAPRIIGIGILVMRASPWNAVDLPVKQLCYNLMYTDRMYINRAGWPIGRG